MGRRVWIIGIERRFELVDGLTREDLTEMSKNLKEVRVNWASIWWKSIGKRVPQVKAQMGVCACLF